MKPTQSLVFELLSKSHAIHLSLVHSHNKNRHPSQVSLFITASSGLMWQVFNTSKRQNRSKVNTCVHNNRSVMVLKAFWWISCPCFCPDVPPLSRPHNFPNCHIFFFFLKTVDRKTKTLLYRRGNCGRV